MANIPALGAGDSGFESRLSEFYQTFCIGHANFALIINNLCTSGHSLVAE